MDKKENDSLQLKKQINDLLVAQKFDDIKRLLLSYKDITEHDNDLATICYLCTVYELERNMEQLTIFSKVCNVDELLKRYTTLKFFYVE